MIVSSLYCVCYFGYLFAYWSCLPEKTEMPPPDAPDTPEQYKHETIAQFTRAQWYEWDHLVRSPIGWIPNFPNSKRIFIFVALKNLFFRILDEIWLDVIVVKSFLNSAHPS